MVKRVLVIDDDPVVRLLFEELLPTFGYAVTTSATATEGLLQYRNDRQATLVFLDLMLPDMNGLDALKTLRSVELASQPIILMSAHEKTDAILEDYPLKPAAILAKPFTVADLRSLVARFS